MIVVAFWIGVLVAGILLMTFSSDKAVEHSVFFASALGTSPLMIGLVLVSLGTDGTHSPLRVLVHLNRG